MLENIGDFAGSLVVQQRP